MAPVARQLEVAGNDWEAPPGEASRTTDRTRESNESSAGNDTSIAMRNPYTQLYLHLVWATWDRLPLIVPAIEPRVHALLASRCDALGCTALAVGGVENHVHLLVRIKPAVSVSELVRFVKGGASRIVSLGLPPGADFSWQGAYGAFSRRKSDTHRVRRYVERQRAHHAAGTLWPDFERTTERVCPDPDAPGHA